jgi:hypothetical protein
MSEYEKLKKKGMGRGRPRHTPEQQEQSLKKNAMRQEARRRAHLVLKGRYSDEFAEICKVEMKSLERAEASQSKRKKTTRK